MTATEETPTTTGVPFTLNGVELEAHEGENLIDACDRLGVHIPRFCYHPRMTPVGMCRMCLVEIDTGRGPALQPSCMMTVSPNMVVNTESEATVKAQDGVLELLLINHPLDCPVCDKGGECPLQDNAYAFGPGESRFVEEKRHYEKPIPISDLVYLDRERCILCDRCTRFADEVAGDPLIHFVDRGAQTQVNTFPDHPFSSYFSGNTVQICPVGALTAKPYRFKARPWDLTGVESTAAVDSTGARVAVQSSQNRLVRVLGVDSDAVNWGWLSDKERFIHEATDAEDRLTDPLTRDANGEFVVRRWVDANRAAGEALSGDADRIGVIGGARLPLEAQFLWARLLEAKGITNVDAQLGDGLDPAIVSGAPRATIERACNPGGVVVLLGADPKEELPSLFLRLRHAVAEDGVKLIELTPRASGLSSYAKARLHALPGTAAEVAAAISTGASAAVGGVDAAELAKAAELLGSGAPVTVLVGRANLAESPDVTVAALSALHDLVPDLAVLSGLRRGNVHGAIEMGLTPNADGTEAILTAAVDGRIDTLVLLGADPMADVPNRDLAEAAFAAVSTVVSVDTFNTASTARADVVLPAAAWGEVDGTFCNLEGRLSPLAAKVTAPGQARADWIIAAEVAAAAGVDLEVTTLGETRARMSAEVDALAGIDLDALEGEADGPLLAGDHAWSLSAPSVSVPPVDGYGLRLLVDRTLWDEGTMVHHAPSLAHLATTASVSVAPGVLDRLGVAAGDTVSVGHANGSIELPIKADGRLPEGVARVPYRANGFDAGALIGDGPVVDVRIDRVGS